MQADLARWLLLVALGAAAIALYLAVVWSVLRTQSLSLRKRLFALVPPVAPVMAWRTGHRAMVLVWGIVVGAYVLVRVLAQG